MPKSVKIHILIFDFSLFDLPIVQCSRENGLEEMCGTEDRRMPARHSLADFLQITVDDDNRIVHNHSQRHNQGSQRHGIQLNAKGIEKSQ